MEISGCLRLDSQQIPSGSSRTKLRTLSNGYCLRPWPYPEFPEFRPSIALNRSPATRIICFRSEAETAYATEPERTIARIFPLPTFVFRRHSIVFARIRKRKKSGYPRNLSVSRKIRFNLDVGETVCEWFLIRSSRRRHVRRVLGKCVLS